MSGPTLVPLTPKKTIGETAAVLAKDYGAIMRAFQAEGFTPDQAFDLLLRALDSEALSGEAS